MPNKINKIKEIKEIKEKECVCENAHTHTRTREEEEIFENLEKSFESFRNWCDDKAPLANAFAEPLTIEGFRWLYNKYGAERLKQCAADIHNKSAPAKNRNALNTFKKFISKLP